MRRVVVLPQPDGPSSAKNDPRGTVSDTSLTAVNVPNRLTRPARWRSPPATSVSFMVTCLIPNQRLELFVVLALGLLVQSHEDVALVQRRLVREDQRVDHQVRVDRLHLLPGTLDRADVVHPGGELGRYLRVVVVVHDQLGVLFVLGVGGSPG